MYSQECEEPNSWMCHTVSSTESHSGFTLWATPLDWGNFIGIYCCVDVFPMGRAATGMSNAWSLTLYGVFTRILPQSLLKDPSQAYKAASAVQEHD